MWCGLCVRQAGWSISVVAAAGFVRDSAANSADNAGVVALTDPERACASGTYITAPCTSRADAVCATCSTACQADYYVVSECGEYVDIGCEPCVSCGWPRTSPRRPWTRPTTGVGRYAPRASHQEPEVHTCRAPLPGASRRRGA